MDMNINKILRHKYIIFFNSYFVLIGKIPRLFELKLLIYPETRDDFKHPLE